MGAPAQVVSEQVCNRDKKTGNAWYYAAERAAHGHGTQNCRDAGAAPASAAADAAAINATATASTAVATDALACAGTGRMACCARRRRQRVGELLQRGSRVEAANTQAQRVREAPRVIKRSVHSHDALGSIFRAYLSC